MILKNYITCELEDGDLSPEYFLLWSPAYEVIYSLEFGY